MVTIEPAARLATEKQDPIACRYFLGVYIRGVSMIKTIPGFDNYFATDDGKIFSKNYHREKRVAKIQPRMNERGYMYVSLSKNGMVYTKKVHRLIAETFIPNPENKSEVNHRNGIRTDNSVKNLEWASRSENMKHSFDALHRKPVRAWLGKYGKNHNRAKTILQIKDGRLVNEFYGSHEAYRKTGINHVSIRLVCQGKRKSAGGFQWAYKK